MSIRSEADRLMTAANLLSVLRRHGTPAITGSYFMNTMTWNDLDLYLLPGESFDPHAMIADLTRALRPARLDGFVDDSGTFFGCETFITGQRWNVDIWVRSEDKIAQSLQYCRTLLGKIDAVPDARTAILEIKSGLTAAGMYGFDKHPSRHYHSPEIYAAVLDEGIRTVEEFLDRNPL